MKETEATPPWVHQKGDCRVRSLLNGRCLAERARFVGARGGDRSARADGTLIGTLALEVTFERTTPECSEVTMRSAGRARSESGLAPGEAHALTARRRNVVHGSFSKKGSAASSPSTEFVTQPPRPTPLDKRRRACRRLLGCELRDSSTSDATSAGARGSQATRV